MLGRRLLLCSGLLWGCSGEPQSHLKTAATSSAVTPVLNTFIAQSLEIDQLNGTPPEDANLFVGNDPADASASRQFPIGGPSTFIDWNDLAGDLSNHQLMDLNGANGKDPSSFPRSNECVGESQVLSKMDLTYVASANNNKYAYFAVQRSNNNGDAGYYWLFTRLAPHLNPGEAPCHSGESRLVYDISGPDPSTGAGGDILLGGHFHPNGTPFLTVYRATSSANGVGAVDAINYTSALWAVDASGVAGVAVNTTVTAPGAFGAAGVVGMKGSNLDTEIFAEAAVPIAVFTGGTACGATFYGSVITRSSGSGGTSPDLKDLAGPALFNFGSVKASASLTPTCGLKFLFQASATAPDGSPVANPSCSWSFSNGASSSSCSGLVNGITVAGAGSYTGTVTITDPATSCSDTIKTGSVSLFSPLQVVPSLAATCSRSFTYDAQVSGGSDPANAKFAWAFSGGGTVTPSSSSTKSGSVSVGTPGAAYTGQVTISDPRSDIPCTATGSASATPFAPLAINLNLQTTVQSCPALSSDAVTYQAVPSGGNGVYNLSWFGAACSGISCTINPSDSLFCATVNLYATLSDSSGLCPPATSETETYTKTTTITATNN
jgi:hypothetical protein